MTEPPLSALTQHLVPLPRRIEARPGRFAAPRVPRWKGHERVLPTAFARLCETLDSNRPAVEGTGTIEFRLESSVATGPASASPEAYVLDVTPDVVRVAAATGRGLTQGARTLAQLVRAAGAGSIPALHITDAPALGRRGVMLDVSRDRVPRMDRLFALVDRLADWKLNELQLYFEHAFAYRGHEGVWRGVDPFTPDEIRALDGHCRERGIELVPNQQSFGHLHHWLKHEAYRHLAEVPQGIVHPFLEAGGKGPEPFSLCPTDPRSLAFLDTLYDQLLPCFSSGDLNVGLDETIDLGIASAPGRSAAAVQAKGVGRVYLDFLKGVHALVSKRGKRMQFWADIVLHHAELVPEVPRDALACLWGYEADHPFERETEVLAAAGLPFVVCPGTSSWQSIGGRIENMVANVTSAARWGAERGAQGLLITDWGDRGHLQPPCVSWPGFLMAADASWNPEAGAGSRLGPVLEAVLGPDLGRLLGELGRAAAPCRVPVRNASPLALLLTRFDEPFPQSDLSGLKPAELTTIAHERRTCRPRDQAILSGPVRPLEATEQARFVSEVSWANDLLAFCAHLGLARLEAGDGRPLSELASRTRTGLADELEPLIDSYRELWLETSRPGGLARSVRWLERPLEALRQR